MNQKTYEQFISESSSDTRIPFENVANNVTIATGDVAYKFDDAIASVEQKNANSWQYIFELNSFDKKEFGKSGVYRISTKMSNNKDKFNRTIVKINVLKGTLTHIDHDYYEENNKVKWMRPNKLKFLTIGKTSLSLFNII